jgi:RNA recognition motif-containing protein
MPMIMVNNIPYAAQKNELVELFRQFGQVAGVTLVGGRGPKYALVDMATTADAVSAIKATHGTLMHRQRLRVEPRFPVRTVLEYSSAPAVRADPLLPWCPWSKHTA